MRNKTSKTKDKEGVAQEELPAWLEGPPAGASVPPPVETRHRELPFGSLTWENFERLCLELARREPDAETCRLYGTPGQGQGGVDLVARLRTDGRYRAYQCKREKAFGPAKITEAVDEFLGGNWALQVTALVLCTQQSLRPTKHFHAFEAERKRLEAKGIGLVAWDSEELTARLRKHPDLVDAFFGREWVRVFLGPDVAASLRPRPDPAQASNPTIVVGPPLLGAASGSPLFGGPSPLASSGESAAVTVQHLLGQLQQALSAPVEGENLRLQREVGALLGRVCQVLCVFGISSYMI